MLTEDRIQEAYNGMKAAIKEMASIVETLTELKNKRAVELAQKVEAGLYADCKNEDQRKAAAAFHFQATDAIIKSCEASERAARLKVELAQNDIGMVEALLKLYALPK